MTDNSKWDEDAIIERYHQLSLARDGGVAVGVDEAIDAATEIYKDMQATIAELEQQLAEARKRKPMRVITQPDFVIDWEDSDDE